MFDMPQLFVPAGIPLKKYIQIRVGPTKNVVIPYSWLQPLSSAPTGAMGGSAERVRRRIP